MGMALPMSWYSLLGMMLLLALLEIFTYEMETGGHCEHIAPYRILRIEVKSLVMDSMEVTVLTCKCTEIDGELTFPRGKISNMRSILPAWRVEEYCQSSLSNSNESGINGIQRTVDTLDTEDGGDTGYTHVARSTA